jgi:hypothetical protein
LIISLETSSSLFATALFQNVCNHLARQCIEELLQVVGGPVTAKSILVSFFALALGAAAFTGEARRVLIDRAIDEEATNAEVIRFEGDDTPRAVHAGVRDDLVSSARSGDAIPVDADRSNDDHDRMHRAGNRTKEVDATN